MGIMPYRVYFNKMPRLKTRSITYTSKPRSRTFASAPLSAAPQINQPIETAPQFGSCMKAKVAGFDPCIAGVDPEYEWHCDDGAIYE